MAKMGQPMLPFLAGTAGSQLDSSDSEIEVHHRPQKWDFRVLFPQYGFLEGESVAVAVTLPGESMLCLCGKRA